MPTAIAMLMRNGHDARSGSDAYAQLARDYPTLVLVIDAGFAVCSAVAHALRRRRTRRVLDALNRHLLRDIGLTPENLRSVRLDAILKRQHPPARPERTWARLWRAALVADRSRKALAALGHDELHALSEQGLKARREAQHDHHSG